MGFVVGVLGLIFGVALLSRGGQNARQNQVSELPDAIAEPIAKYVGGLAVAKQLTEANAKGAYDALTRMARNSERLYRQEAAATQAQNERDLARARQTLLSSLTEHDRGLLAMRLRETADAEARARAAFDVETLKKEKHVLEQTATKLRVQLAKYESIDQQQREMHSP
jgi:hypothetical protein